MRLFLLKTPVHPSARLRANGEGIENLKNFPFMLILVEAFLGFFSRIFYNASCPQYAFTGFWLRVTSCACLTTFWLIERIAQLSQAQSH
jgi:hypothetical protein